MMPTWLFYIVMAIVPDALQPMPGKVMLYVLLLVFITTFVIPLLSMLGLKSTATISSLQLTNRKERILPFFFITVFYGLTTYLFYIKIEINDFLLSIFIGATLVVAFITITTIFFKISVHAAASGCMIGALLATMNIFPEFSLIWPLSLIILISGLILSARLTLNAHNVREVYLGLFMGIIICYFSIYFLS
jgi:hypothetical protein